MGVDANSIRLKDRRIKISALILISFFLLNPSHSRADIKSTCASLLRRIANFSVRTFTKSFENITVVTLPYIISTGTEVGYGNSARVSELVEITDSASGKVLYRPESGTEVVKIPSCWATSSRLIPLCDHMLRQETLTYDRILTWLSQNQIDLNYYSSGTLKAGSAPIIPILMRFETDKGLILVKPRAFGKSMAKLKSIFKGTFPNEVLIGLQEVFQFQEKLQEIGIMLDLNPPNLIWIDQPDEMAKFGLLKPGFIFFEFSEWKMQVFNPKGFFFKDFLRLIRDVK